MDHLKVELDRARRLAEAAHDSKLARELREYAAEIERLRARRTLMERTPLPPADGSAAIILAPADRASGPAHDPVEIRRRG